MGRLDVPGCLVTTLPSDPLRPTLDTGDRPQAHSVLPSSFGGATVNGVSNLQYSTVTNEAAVRFARIGAADKWSAFVALRQEGGIEVGMGSVARFNFSNSSPLEGKAGYRLFTLVHAVRVVIESQARLIERQGNDDLGPFELIVAIPNAGGAVLSAFAEGWSNPEYDDSFELPTCSEENLFWRCEVDPWPLDTDDREGLLVSVASRLCSGFNVNEHRFLPRLSTGLGPLDPGYA